YVLAGYGTGAIMAVPCGDQRDFLFANHFKIPVTNIIGDYFNGVEANPTKEATLQNSGFLNGLLMKDAINIAVNKIEELGIGIRKVNYKMRDAGFSRQRYWGEPFPVIWSDGVAIPLDADELPLELPHVDKYGPGPDGEGPLANINSWVYLNDLNPNRKPSAGSGSTLLWRGARGEVKRETSTMPGYAGSSWYFLRYMDPHNTQAFCDRKASDYWGQVDIYIGGTEHAVGHLLYSRMWTKILFDLGYIGHDEPYKKLVNQGMITGKSYFFNISLEDDVNIGAVSEKITSYNKEEPSYKLFRFKYGHQFVEANGKLTEKQFKKSGADVPYKIDWDIDSEGNYIILKEESEKMSKSKFNVDSPDDIVEKYGADTFRMYEMFLGPVEQSKPWDTKGIEGVHRFLRKLWRLFYDDQKGKLWNEDKATTEELKVLHRTIKKIDEDTGRFSFNTAVSTFMICVNDLADLNCHKKEILEPLLFLLSPYAPHISEELCSQIGSRVSPIGGDLEGAVYPVFNPALLVENSKEYPVSINGRVRTSITMALDITQADVVRVILLNEVVQKWLDGKEPKKIIYVKNKMVNVVI
ncbi:MAG: class I tRNA ligase family protein, partial [Ferruginibacter sp.]